VQRSACLSKTICAAPHCATWRSTRGTTTWELPVRLSSTSSPSFGPSRLLAVAQGAVSMVKGFSKSRQAPRRREGARSPAVLWHACALYRAGLTRTCISSQHRVCAVVCLCLDLRMQLAVSKLSALVDARQVPCAQEPTRCTPRFQSCTGPPSTPLVA